VRSEELGQRKIAMTPPRIELTTFRLVAQCLNGCGGGGDGLDDDDDDIEPGDDTANKAGQLKPCS
jgi:hypothetical protein